MASYEELGSYTDSVDNIKFQTDIVKRSPFHDNAAYRAEKEINLLHLKDLMAIFQANSHKRNGYIVSDEFASIFGAALGGMSTEQLEKLFMQIDVDLDGMIDWDDFSSYLLLRSEGQKLMKDSNDGNLVDKEGNGKKTYATHHKEMIIKVQYIKPLKRYMTCCREGTICYWNDAFRLQRVFLNAGQLQSEKKQRKSGNETTFQGTPYRWIHDALYCPSLQKVILSSDDHQITFYEGSTMERLLCFDLEKTNALTIAFHPGKDNLNSMLIYGTDSGYVNVFTFDEHKLLQIAARQKGQIDTLYIERENPSSKLKQIGSLWKRKAHSDWVLKVGYAMDLKLIVSVSPDPKNSLSVAQFGNNHNWNLSSCSISKGLNCFTYCSFPLTLATGGTDRKIRLWNPHRLNVPTSTLIGHQAPIVELTVNPLAGHLFSLCSNKEVKIWNIRNQNCLQTIINSTKLYPDNLLSCLCFNYDDEGASIITSSNVIQKYRMRHVAKVQNNIKSHDHPIRRILYNQTFKEIISGCDGGAINVWDSVSGHKSFKFMTDQKACEITALAFDTHGRKLITGSRDGSIKVWNYHNGELLQELIQTQKAEVTGIQYITMKKISFIVATGWNGKISMFLDTGIDSYTVHPKFVWPKFTEDDKFPWHSDDILSMAYLPPSMLATSSYNGDIIICNMNSGKISQHFNPHDQKPLGFPRQKRSIDKILYLSERNANKSATLVSSGGDGTIRFWFWQTGTLFFEKNCTQGRDQPIYSMISNNSNSVLCLGDSAGWISIYDISRTGLKNDLEAAIQIDTMPLITSFKSHAEDITDIQLINKVIVTSSTDCTVRLFTSKGQFIGILGQNNIWDLENLDLTSVEIPADLMNQKVEESENQHRVKLPEVKTEEQKKTINPKGEQDNMLVDSWFARSIYAREKFLKQSHEQKQASHRKIYHELAELPLLSLPKIRG